MGYRVALFHFVWESGRKRDGEREDKKERDEGVVKQKLADKNILTKKPRHPGEEVIQWQKILSKTAQMQEFPHFLFFIFIK